MCVRGATIASGCFNFPIYNTANISGGVSIANSLRELELKYLLIAVHPSNFKEIPITISSARYSFGNCPNLVKIYGILDFSIITTNANLQYFAQGSPLLKEVRISGLKVDFDISRNPAISLASMYYMIANAGTAAITITLHADVYDSIFDDEGELTEAAIAAGITEDLLSTKSNVTLASA